MDRPTALVTGASGGIGNASVHALLDVGFDVYAGVRRAGSATDLTSAGAHEIALDVSDETSMASAVHDVEQLCGAVDVLVNNAGYAIAGPIEEVSVDALRGQLEVNVVGVVRMSQLVLPACAPRKAGGSSPSAAWVACSPLRVRAPTT